MRNKRENGREHCGTLQWTYESILLTQNAPYQEAPVLTALPIRPPIMDAVRSMDSIRWGPRELAALIVFCIAASGALFAAWIQLSCISDKPVITPKSDAAVFFGMHFGAIVCSISSNMLRGKRGWRQALLQSSNQPLLIKAVGIYFTVVFFYGWVRMAAGDGEPGDWGILMFSAGWLLFYGTAALAAWRAMQTSHGDPS